MPLKYSVLVAVLVLAPLAARADGNVRSFDYPSADGTALRGVNDHNIAVGGAIIFPDIYTFTWRVDPDVPIENGARLPDEIGTWSFKGDSPCFSITDVAFVS
jgi:hypothetical protein